MEVVIVMNEQLDKLLASVNWKEFEIGEIFEIKSGVRLTKNDMVSGDTPFIGATDSNNGITNFISNENASLDSNVLGVNYDGSVVENFYHPYEALFSDSVKRLSFKEIDGNKYHYLFLKTMILEQKEKYMYAYKFNAGRMIKQKILLPATPDGQPDWNFMDEYMRMVEESVRPSLGFTEHVITDKRELEDVEWDEFEIGSLFDKVSIAPSSDMNALVSGDIPFVGRSSTGNGLQSEVSVEDTKVIDGNSITIGMVGEPTAFYHKYSFTCSQNILVLQLNDNMNEHTAMFLNTVLNKHLDAKGYGYGHPVSLLRIRRDVIQLPVTPNGEPDWNFMEQYMKRIENDIMKDININNM